MPTMPADDDLDDLDELPVAEASENVDQPDDFESEADEERAPETVDARSKPADKPRIDPRLEELERSAREASERARRFEEELQRERAERQRAASAPKEPSAEEMALWTQDQIIDYKLGKAKQEQQQQLQQLAWATYETNDKAAFAALCASDPVAKKFAPKVEKELAELRARGQNVEREKLLDYIYGKESRAGAASRSKAADRARDEGRQRIERNRPAQSNARSDTAASRGRMSEREARLKRLEGYTF